MTRSQSYLLKKPNEQRFYRNMIYWLSILGMANQTAWGYEELGKFSKFWHYFIPVLAPIALILQIAYLIDKRDALTFGTMGDILAILPVTFIICTNFITSRLKTFRKVMKEFMTKIHLHNYKHEAFMNDKGLIRIERLSRYSAYFLITCIMIDWVFWISLPIATNIQNIEKIRNKTQPLDAFIYFWTPFDYSYDIRNWICLHFVDIFAGWAGCSAVSVFNSLVYIFVFQLIGHIKALKQTIRVKLQVVSDEVEVSRNLIEIIKYHVFIKTIFKEIQKAFGLNVTVSYIHNLIADALLLYQVVFGEKESFMTHGLMILLYMGSLILISFVLEEITIQSNELSDILYSMPWENMSVRNRKIFLILFSQVQIPLTFIGAGGLRTGVNPMISIVKSTFSYYIMLKSTMK